VIINLENWQAGYCRRKKRLPQFCYFFLPLAELGTSDGMIIRPTEGHTNY